MLFDARHDLDTFRDLLARLGEAAYPSPEGAE